MAPKEILKMPYVQFILGMIDAPSIDYDKKTKKSKKQAVADTVESQIATVAAALL